MNTDDADQAIAHSPSRHRGRSMIGRMSAMSSPVSQPGILPHCGRSLPRGRGGSVVEVRSEGGPSERVNADELTFSYRMTDSRRSRGWLSPTTATRKVPTALFD